MPLSPTSKIVIEWPPGNPVPELGSMLSVGVLGIAKVTALESPDRDIREYESGGLVGKVFFAPLVELSIYPKLMTTTAPGRSSAQ